MTTRPRAERDGKRAQLNQSSIKVKIMIVKNSGKFMKAKFKSICPQTGHSINRGQKIFYSFLTKKAYCEDSHEYKKQNQTAEQRGDYLEDPAEIAADNWINNYYGNR